MKSLLLKNDKPQGIEQGTVLGINKLTGRISLSLRNGLVSSGSYLYDINDLRIGDSVLVSKVSNSYVILNKVPINAPNGKGFTFSRALFKRYMFMDYFNLNGYSDAFSGTSLDMSMWGNNYPILNYVDGQWQEDLYIDPEQTPDSLLKVSEGVLWYDAPCLTQHTGGANCQHFVSSGEDISIETCAWFTDNVYQITALGQMVGNTVTVNCAKIYIKIEKIGKVWAALYKKKITDSWSLLLSYTKTTDPDYIAYGYLSFQASYNGVIIVGIHEAYSHEFVLTDPDPHSVGIQVNIKGALLS